MTLGGIFFISVLAVWFLDVPRAESFSGNNWDEVEKFVLQTRIEGRFLPKVTSKFPSLTVMDAYKIQNSFIDSQEKKAVVAGYKAGFTGIEGREQFGLRHPVSGVLFEGCGYKDGVSISLEDHPGLMLELEIGFRLKQTIHNRLENIKELDALVSSAFPVIELPQVRFKNLKDLTGVDLVSVNMASACWIEGKQLSGILPEDYDSIEVSLYLNGESIDSGLSGVVNGQRNALMWLINHLHERNIKLDAGLLLLTGKIGKINLGRVGEYEAKYGDDKIAFHIVP